MKIGAQLPPLYLSLLPPSLKKIHPEEKLATCDRCLLSQNPKKAKFYAPHLKCCTYHPFLPNYIVGAILSEDQQELKGAQQVLRSKMDRCEYALPLGMVAPLPLQVEYNNYRDLGFGLHEDWLCPYFDREHHRCGIWRWRGAVCTGFYCASSYGSSGLEFWKSLENYISFIEMSLMEEALNQMNFSPRRVVDMIDFLNRSEPLSKEWNRRELTRAQMGIIWEGVSYTPENFYKKCFQIIKKLNRRTFLEIIGEKGQELEAQVVKKGLTL